MSGFTSQAHGKSGIFLRCVPIKYNNRALEAVGKLLNYLTSQQTQHICITFVQYWTNAEDVGPTLYKCYTNVLCLLGERFKS